MAVLQKFDFQQGVSLHTRENTCRCVCVCCVCVCVCVCEREREREREREIGEGQITIRSFIPYSILCGATLLRSPCISVMQKKERG